VVPRIDPTTFGHPGFFTTLSFTHNFVTHHLSLSHTIFHIQLCPTQLFLLLDPSALPCLSFLPRPATTFVANYWKKLTCRVFRSFNLFFLPLGLTYFLWIVEVGPQNSLLAFFFVWHQLDNVSKTMRSHFVKRFIRTSLLIFTPRYMVRSPKVATTQNRCCIQGWCNPYVIFFCHGWYFSDFIQT